MKDKCGEEYAIVLEAILRPLPCEINGFVSPRTKIHLLVM